MREKVANLRVFLWEFGGEIGIGEQGTGIGLTDFLISGRYSAAAVASTLSQRILSTPRGSSQKIFISQIAA